MSVQTRMIIAGVVGAVVVGGLMIGLAALGGDTNSGLILTAAVCGGIATAFFCGMLSGNRRIASATNAERDAALAREAPPGKALLYLFREGFGAKLAGMNVSVDGSVVAQLKSPRFTCVVVSPGVHTVNGGFGGVATAKPAGCEIEAPAGGAAAVRFSFNVLSGVSAAPEADVAAVRRKLAGMPLTAPDIAEVG